MSGDRQIAMTTTVDASMDSAYDTPKTKKPYQRVITDKRRQQNRDSQKKYRQRLKARLEDLEDQVAAQNQEASEDVDQHGSLNRAETEESRRTTTTVLSSDFDKPTSNPWDQEPPATLIDLNAAFEAAGDLALPAGTNLNFVTAFQYPARPKRTDLPFLVPDYNDDSTYSSAAASPYSAAEYMIPSDPNSPDCRMIWPVDVSARIKHYTPPSPSSSLSPSPFGGQLPPHLFTPQVSYASLSSESGSSFFGLPFGSRRHSAFPTSPASSTNLPDPYLNTILISGERCMNATFSIANVLSITQSAYINDHPSLFYRSPSYPNNTIFSSLSLSLFPSPQLFESTLSSTSYPASPTSESYHHLPRTLRPTTAQLTLPHPTYLDCIIFPAFRSRAIELSAQGKLDHCALFLDLLHDGLVCWGNARRGDASGDLTGTTGGSRAKVDMRDGQAWSRRSWEARPWFLRRWAMLVGSDDDEGYSQEAVRDEDGIWEQSRWFWAMRGEEEDEQPELVEMNGSAEDLMGMTMMMAEEM